MLSSTFENLDPSRLYTQRGSGDMQWKVAVVEDDRRLARAVTAGLRREGYQVRTAGSAEEGFSMVQAWRPDVILLDLMLPDNEGPGLFARFRNLTGAALVGMTARSMLADVVAGLRLGADDYVTKPFAMEELSARVGATVLGRSCWRSATCPWTWPGARPGAAAWSSR
jgi:DNA-binding response OmpR family regulator